MNMRYLRSLNLAQIHLPTKRKLQIIFLSAVFLVTVALSWKILSQSESTLQLIISTLAHSVANPLFYTRVSLTFSYLLLGVLISLPLALILGLLAGRKRQLDNILMPIGIVVGSLPSFAIGPVAVFLLGPTMFAVILAVTPQSFFLQFELIRTGAKEIPHEFFNTASAFKFNNWHTFTKVIIPPILPRIIESFRLCLTTMWDTVMAAEVFANVFGVGSFVLITNSRVEMTSGLIGVIAVILMAVIVDKLILRNMEEWLGRWR